MPMRFRRTRERRGGRRARRSLPPILFAYVFILVVACGGDDESLNTTVAADTPAVGSVSEAPQEAGGDAGSETAALEDMENAGAGITLRASAADNIDDACLGAKEVTVEPEALLFFCVEVANQGRIPLTDVEVLARDQRLDLSQFMIAVGDFARIDPEGFLIAILVEPVLDGRLAGRIAEEGFEVWLEAGAIPVDAGGVEMEKILANTRILVQVRQHDSPTGFASAVATGADTLLSIANRFPLAMGFLVLVPLLALTVAAGSRVRGRRKAGRLPN